MFQTSVKSFKSFTLKMTVISLAVFGYSFIIGAGGVNAQAINEGFENVAGLPSQGWFSVNKSQPLGASVWSQCSGTTIPPAQSGPTTSCALVNFNSTTGTGTISNWLMAPVRTLNNGDTFSFYTRTPSNTFPDRLQLRLSLSGSSTNTGTTALDVGDFTTLLVDVNPTYGANYPLTWTQFTATISGLSGPTSGRVAFRYFVENGGPTGDNSNIIGIDTFVYTPAPVLTPGKAPVDFNGDGKTDWSVVRNVNGQLIWYYNTNGTGAATAAFAWGLPSDILVPADYDGDGKTDIAVYRPGSPGVFYILQSQTNTLRVENFGLPGDDPTVVADYNGDGKDDIAVYRAGANLGDQSTWFYKTAPGGNTTFIPWGVNGDKVAPGDYDGDGKADFVIRRNNGGQGVYWTRLATGAVSVETFGFFTDIIIPGDYDGDGKTDLAVGRVEGSSYRWFIKPSSGAAVQQFVFGLVGDTIVQGDYDGDGKTDAAIWRNGTFWVRNSTNGATQNFGLGSAGDIATAGYNTH